MNTPASTIIALAVVPEIAIDMKEVLTIRHFNGKKIFLCKFQMEFSFQACDLWTIVNGEFKHDDADDKPTWDKEDKCTTVNIITVVDMQQIVNCNSSVNMWATPIMFHKQCTKENVTYLMK